MKIQIPIFESHLLPAVADGIQKLEFEFSFKFQLRHWNSKTRFFYVYDTKNLEILYIYFFDDIQNKNISTYFNRGTKKNTCDTHKKMEILRYFQIFNITDM